MHIDLHAVFSELSAGPTSNGTLTNRKVIPIKASTAIASVQLASFISSMGKGPIEKPSDELLLWCRPRNQFSQWSRFSTQHSLVAMKARWARVARRGSTAMARGTVTRQGYIRWKDRRSVETSCRAFPPFASTPQRALARTSILLYNDWCYCSIGDSTLEHDVSKLFVALQAFHYKSANVIFLPPEHFDGTFGYAHPLGWYTHKTGVDPA